MAVIQPLLTCSKWNMDKILALSFTQHNYKNHKESLNPSMQKTSEFPLNYFGNQNSFWECPNVLGTVEKVKSCFWLSPKSFGISKMKLNFQNIDRKFRSLDHQRSPCCVLNYSLIILFQQKVSSAHVWTSLESFLRKLKGQTMFLLWPNFMRMKNLLQVVQQTTNSCTACGPQQGKGFCESAFIQFCCNFGY